MILLSDAMLKLGCGAFPFFTVAISYLSAFLKIHCASLSTSKSSRGGDYKNHGDRICYFCLAFNKNFYQIRQRGDFLGAIHKLITAYTDTD